MIEKITNLAERMATNISMPRRGFLGRVGQAALGVVGVAGGLLALPTEAAAEGAQGYCRVIPRVPPSRFGRGHPAYLDGECVRPNPPNSTYCNLSSMNSRCPRGAPPRSSRWLACDYLCQFGTCFGLYIDTTRPCTL
jgi:hypothetical protein